MLDNTTDQLLKFRAKYWVEIKDEAYGTYSTNSQTKFKTTMLKSSLCDYSDAYLLIKRTIIVVGQGPDPSEIAADRKHQQVIFKNCAPFTNCRSEINNTQAVNMKDIDFVMLMYNLIEYSNNY